MAQQQEPQEVDVKQIVESVKPYILDVFRNNELKTGRFLVMASAYLKSCDKKVRLSTFRSVCGGLLKAAELDLRLGTNNECYLSGRKNKQNGGLLEAAFQTGYPGLLRLAYRSNKIAAIAARAVYECDEFEYQYGTDAKVYHKPGRRAESHSLIAAYSIATLTCGVQQFDVIEADDIVPIMKAAKGYSNAMPAVWITYPGMMWRKSSLNRLLKMLPSYDDVASDAIQSAVHLNDQVDAGPDVSQNLGADLEDDRQGKLFDEDGNAAGVDFESATAT